MGRLSGALQALQDEASTWRSSSSSRGGHDVMALAGQLLHAGRQDRAAQVCVVLSRLVVSAVAGRLMLEVVQTEGGRVAVCFLTLLIFVLLLLVLVQVLPYLQVLAAAPSRLWLHALLPRSWAYTWQGSICERPSQALQGQGAGAVAAALEAAAAAVGAAAVGATTVRGLSEGADRGGGVVVQEEHEVEEGQESDEEIESDSE